MSASRAQPISKRIICFPGQGSQRVGMFASTTGETSPYARVVRACGATVDRGLEPSTSLERAMREGPKELLSRTDYAQCAILAHSVGLWRTLQSSSSPPTPSVLVGHSLGEYSALVVAESLTIEEASDLVLERSLAMKEAFERWGRQPRMAAVLGLSYERAVAVSSECPADLVCDVANENGPGQTVLSGDVQGVEWVTAKAKQNWPELRLRAIKLDVSAPFHSRVMLPAAERLERALEQRVSLRAPKYPIVFGSDPDGFDLNKTPTPEEIRRNLTSGLVKTVRFGSCLAAAAKALRRDAGLAIELQEVGSDVLTKTLRGQNPLGLVAMKSIESVLDAA